MIFGEINKIAIEVGEIITYSDPHQLYIQFRFILFGHCIGDWDDRIAITIPWRNMEEFLSFKEYRSDFTLKTVDSDTFFDRTYTTYYRDDYSPQSILIPNLRDRYHFSDIGGDSVSDAHAIVVAEVEPNRSRFVVKDLRADHIIIDQVIDSNEIETMGQDFVKWARHKYCEE